MMELPKDIKDEIWDYCRVNNISSVDDFITKMVKQGFTSEKFGSTPWDKPTEVKEVEVIKEVEKIKEVQVEKIIEVEKIVEVEKKIFVTDDEANIELKKELTKVKETLKLSLSDFEKLDEFRRNLDEKLDEFRRNLDEKEKEIVILKEKLEIEKNKPKEEDGDIYGGKEGFLGSNTSDLWKKKK